MSDRVASASLPAAPLPAEFHAAFLDFCGSWGAKRLAAGKKRRRDVELLFAARLLAPGGSVLGVTCAGPGWLLSVFPHVPHAPLVRTANLCYSSARWTPGKVGTNPSPWKVHRLAHSAAGQMETCLVRVSPKFWLF